MNLIPIHAKIGIFHPLTSETKTSLKVSKPTKSLSPSFTFLAINQILSKKPPAFKKLDQRDERLAAKLLSCRGLSAPILPATYDAFKRSYVPSRPRISAMYEMPTLCAIHRGWHRQYQTSSRSRVLHPFDQVDTESQKALDRFGNLRKTITEYLLYTSDE